MVISACVIIISAINYWLGNDKEQEIQSVSIGLGMLFCSLALWLYFHRHIHEDFSSLLCIATLTPVLGALIGPGGLKMFRHVYESHSKNHNII